MPAWAVKLLSPIGYLYSLAIGLRNQGYNHRWLTVYNPTRFTISVGNLAVGGTGKTPCVAYLVNLLQKTYNIAVISRGYKRRTCGYRLASEQQTASSIGDEPYQLYRQALRNNWRVWVVVGEDRARAIDQLLQTHPDTQLIFLDDGFQHRRVNRQINLLLTCFHRPFFEDQLLPLGQLREPRCEASRSDAVLVTKCPAHVPAATRSYFKNKIEQYCKKKVPIFFGHIIYGKPMPVFDNRFRFTAADAILLVTGIADPQPMIKYVQEKYNFVHNVLYPDHHFFDSKDINHILSIFDTIRYKKKCILMTEKDAMRLITSPFVPLLQGLPVFYLPCSMGFEDEGEFVKYMIDTINDKHF